MFNLFSRTPYRIGVALSGGGARGFAHIGALQAMDECGLRPDILAGVSAGSVVAVMYAAGLSANAMLEAFEGATFSGFTEIGMPRGGLFGFEGFKEFIRRVTGVKRLEDLKIPTVIGATDLVAGRPVMFEQGEIGDVVAASCAIPIVFKPVTIDGVRYVDGGVLHNLPAWTIRSRCRNLFGINVSCLPTREVHNSVLDMAMRSYELVTKTNSVQDMSLCDLVISMDSIADYKVFNLKEIRKVYQIGYINTMDMLLANGFKPRRRMSRS